jgi:Stage II sporulation protein E (SpoIIE)
MSDGANSQVTWGKPRLVEAAGNILERSRLTPPDGLNKLVGDELERAGATGVTILLVDLAQEVLVPLDSHPPEVRSLDRSRAGRAYRLQQIVESRVQGGHKLFVPIIDGRDRLGVLELVVPSHDSEMGNCLEQFSGLLGELIVTKDLYGDALTVARRRHEMSLAAEMQWELLPPLTAATPNISIAGILEPSYDIGGDSFDYAINGDVAHIAILDAMGHGLPASLTAALAIGSYRNSRRLRRGLHEIYEAMNELIARNLGPERFVTGLLGELDSSTGRFRWINAGHPLPLLVRDGQVVASPECEPSQPLGMGGDIAEVAEHHLEPGDSLLLFTDGVIEARSDREEAYGDERLSRTLERQLQADLSSAEIVRGLARSLLEHRTGSLQDDATMLLLQWRGP